MRGWRIIKHFLVQECQSVTVCVAAWAVATRNCNCTDADWLLSVAVSEGQYVRTCTLM